MTVSNVETIAGSGSADNVTLGSALTSAVQIDLGAGNDKLFLGNFANTGSASNVETIIGGTDADTITLATVASKTFVDLGVGSDSLTLGNFVNTVTVIER